MNDPVANPTRSSPHETEIAVAYEHSGQLGSILSGLNTSVLLSTYQAGKLLAIGTVSDRPTFSFHSFEQVMGVAIGRDRIAIGSRRQIHFLRAAHEVAQSLPPAGTFDSCFLTRTSITTGSIHGHDLAFGTEGLWVVNTLFSCLCTLDEEFNFFPRWRPSFITQLIDQDRCHLNGLALDQGVPRYVTVLGITDEPAGWRVNKRSGGAILDVASGEVVSRGLCMPHSPRVYQGKLWVLNSGCGELSVVDTATGRLQVVASLPGYARGLSFLGDYAFVGLSRIRETNVFGGLPIGERPDQLHCGLGIVELSTGRTIATLRFKTGVEELFAVEVLPGCLNPRLVGPSLSGEEDNEVWIVPALHAQTMSPRMSFGALSAPQSADLGTAELLAQSDAAHASNDPVAALDLLQRALAIEPNSPMVWNRLGNLRQDLNDTARAAECYQRALIAEPRFATAHQNLGVLCTADNEPHRALHHFEKAQQYAPSVMNLLLAAKVLPIIYDSKDQVHYWRKRLTACVADLSASGMTIDTSNTLIPTSFHFAYHGENDRSLMEQLARVYRGADLCVGIQEGAQRPTQKRIRVGFVSAYFCQHTIGLLNVGVIEHLPRDRFEVYVIALKHLVDHHSDRFRKAADHYVEVSRHPAQARQTIAALGLDVLIFADVGMDCLSQTLSYSRMAPRQAATWGHPDTTGSSAIDYFISTQLAEPADAQDHYSERLICHSTFGIYYERPKLEGEVRDAAHFGLDPKRRIYLCPQTLFKFHPDFDVPLRRILESDPNGDLVVLRGSTPRWVEPLMKRWRTELPDADRRVRFLPSLPRKDFLHLLSIADVMLDPFPFCGGNTSYEALGLGTPVVTLPDRFLRGRLTHGLYQRMQMPSLSVESVQEYVDLAVELGIDKQRNHHTRQTIREQSALLFENREDIASWEHVLNKIIG